MIIFIFWILKSNIVQGTHKKAIQKNFLVFLKNSYHAKRKKSNISVSWHKKAIQKKISVFLKKVITRKGKNPTLVYPKLRYAHQQLDFASKTFLENNFGLRTKFDLRLKKNCLVQFQNYLEIEIFLSRHKKNASHTIAIYRSCMISIFSKRK